MRYGLGVFFGGGGWWWCFFGLENGGVVSPKIGGWCKTPQNGWFIVKGKAL